MKIKETIIKTLTSQNIYTSFKTNDFTNNLYIYNNEENINLIKNRYTGNYNGYLVYIVSKDNDLVLQLLKK